MSGLPERVNLGYAQREAESLKRWADANNREDLAEFAVMTLRLIAEVREARTVLQDIGTMAEEARAKLLAQAGIRQVPPPPDSDDEDDEP